VKLLLTSAGLTNDILKKTFLDLVGKEPGDITIAFITTASNTEKNTDYIKRDRDNLKRLGVQYISLIDISQPETTWKEVLQKSDVIYVEGGNTFYLLDELRKSGLNTTLKNITRGKLYVGVSAGSIIVTPTIAIAQVEPADPNTVNLQDLTGLNWVPFEISPHTREVVPLANVEQYAASTVHPVYAFDDEVAIVVTEKKISFVGNGFNTIYNT
jgi:dipeptidase E